mgnify:FL=1
MYRAAIESKKKVGVVTPTRKAADNLINRGVKDAQTIDSFFESVVGVDKKIDVQKIVQGYDIIFIDEFSQISYRWWSAFMKAKWHRPQLQFYVFGDPNQCKPVETFHCDVAGSDLMSFLVGGVREYINYNPATGRYTERTFKLLQKFLATGTPTKALIKLVEGKFHMPDFTITATNAKRWKVNKKMARRFLKKASETFELGDRTFAVGMPIICYENNKYATNSQAFKISRITDKSVFLAGNPTLDNKSKKKIEVPIADFTAKSKSDRANYVFEYGFASTVNKIQGMTIHGYFNILEADKMSRNNFYTALSRCTDLDYVAVPHMRDEYEPTYYEKSVELKWNKYEKQLRGIIYRIVDKMNATNGVYIGLSLCREEETYEEAAKRRLEEHKKKPTNDNMKTFLKNDVKIEILHQGTMSSEKTLERLETIEIEAHVYKGCEVLNVKKVPKQPEKVPQIPEQIQEAIEQKTVREVTLEAQIEERIRNRDVKWLLENGIIGKEENASRFVVHYYEGKKKQRKYFKYTRDYEKAVSNVLEFLKEKSMRL